MYKIHKLSVESGRTLRPGLHGLYGGTTMSDKQTRRHFTPPEKVGIVKRHLLEGVPVLNLCNEFDINPTRFYQWQRQLFENAHFAFANGRKSKGVEEAKDQKIQQL